MGPSSACLISISNLRPLLLFQGVLTGDGRLVCFAHGACFNSKTGDIEDSPALDSLLSFKCEVEGNNIFVTADPEKLKGKPGVGASCGVEAVEKSGKGTVVVGGGPAAVYLVESARKVSSSSSCGDGEMSSSPFRLI